jgi:hypothetical protein
MRPDVEQLVRLEISSCELVAHVRDGVGLELPREKQSTCDPDVDRVDQEPHVVTLDLDGSRVSLRESPEDLAFASIAAALRGEIECEPSVGADLFAYHVATVVVAAVIRREPSAQDRASFGRCGRCGRCGHDRAAGTCCGAPDTSPAV